MSRRIALLVLSAARLATAALAPAPAAGARADEASGFDRGLPGRDNARRQR